MKPKTPRNSVASQMSPHGLILYKQMLDETFYKKAAMDDNELRGADLWRDHFPE
jgi:hypothetical protein